MRDDVGDLVVGQSRPRRHQGRSAELHCAVLDDHLQILVLAIDTVAVGVKNELPHGEVTGRGYQHCTDRAIALARDTVARGAVGVEDNCAGRRIASGGIARGGKKCH